jgi:hypothetical protein
MRVDRFRFDYQLKNARILDIPEMIGPQNIGVFNGAPGIVSAAEFCPVFRAG